MCNKLAAPSPSLIRFGKMPSHTSNIHPLKNSPFHNLMKGGKETPGGIKQSVQYNIVVGMWWYRKKFSWITVSTIGTNRINFEHFWAILTNFNYFFLENKNFWEKKLQMRTVLQNENTFFDFRLPESIFFLQYKDKSIMSLWLDFNGFDYKIQCWHLFSYK